MEQNPYAPSQVPHTRTPNSHDAVVITPTALAAVTGTQFWVKLIGVVMFIMVAVQLFTILVGLGQTPSRRMSGPGTGVLFVLIIPVIIMVFYCILATRLLQYGKAISALAASRNPLNFERAMEVQTKFWKLLGILTIIMLAIVFFAWASLAASF